MESFVTSFIFTCAVIIFASCWFGAVFSMFKAAANRKPGVLYFRAFNWIRTSLLNRDVYLDDLFNEEGAKHAKRSVYFMLVFAGVLPVALLVHLVAKNLFE